MCGEDVRCGSGFVEAAPGGVTEWEGVGSSLVGFETASSELGLNAVFDRGLATRFVGISVE